MLLNEEAKVCLLHVHFALHLSFWHMGSIRSLLLIEWDNFTYGLITVNYQQREEFAGGQLNHGFSERLPRISVLCYASQWHFAPPQRTTAPRTSIPGASFCWEPSSKQQPGNCTALGEAWRGNWRQHQYFLPLDSRSSDFRAWKLMSSLVVVFVKFIGSLSMSWCILWQVARCAQRDMVSGQGGEGLIVGLDGHSGLFQPGWFYDLLFHIYFYSLDPINTSALPRLYSGLPMSLPFRSLFILTASPWLSPNGRYFLQANHQADMKDHVRTMEGCRRCSFIAWFTFHLWKHIPPE